MVMRSIEEKARWKETRSAVGGRVVGGGEPPGLAAEACQMAQLSPRSTTALSPTPSQRRGRAQRRRTTTLARPRPSRFVLARPTRPPTRRDEMTTTPTSLCIKIQVPEGTDNGAYVSYTTNWDAEGSVILDEYQPANGPTTEIQCLVKVRTEAPSTDARVVLSLYSLSRVPDAGNGGAALPRRSRTRAPAHDGDRARLT